MSAFRHVTTFYTCGRKIVIYYITAKERIEYEKDTSKQALTVISNHILHQVYIIDYVNAQLLRKIFHN